MCECINCGQHARDKHHCVFRSKVKALTKCPKNIVDLCGECHYDIHHRAKSNIDIKMKLRFQNYLEESWFKNELTYEEIKDTLKISDANVHRILKTCTLKNGCYQREDVIRECMGGRLYTLEDLNRGEKV